MNGVCVFGALTSVGALFLLCGANMKSCSFIGHRNTKQTKELCDEVRKTVFLLIEKEGVTRFLFGSASAFDDLCVKTVKEIQKKYEEIQLIYVRAGDPQITNLYKAYLLETYDDTMMPNGVGKAGKASYIKRNQAMIDESAFCVFYYDETYTPNGRKSGTKLAYEYAKKTGKKIINLYKATKESE